jgi:thiamine-monophosphate kinase
MNTQGIITFAAMEKNRTEIASLGEFGLIDRLAAGFINGQEGSITGIGDDAAVIELPPGEQLLCSCDVLAEGIHFDLSYTPLHLLGYKAVAVNLSDIAAMNGVPRQILVSIGISNRFSVEAVEALYDGIRQACKEYRVDLVGGDTSSSRSGLLLSVTALGSQLPEKIVRRSGAQAGDLICVSGDLGAAYMGLQLLEREKKVFETDPDMQPELAEEQAYLIQRQLKAEARTDIIHEFAEHQIVPTAMIDVSDGLASELLHLARHSGCGLEVFEDKIPVENLTKLAASDFGLSPVTCAMNGGEDYELLFTISQADYEKILKMDDVSIIGVVREKVQGCHLHLRSGQNVAITAQGWIHFTS